MFNLIDFILNIDMYLSLIIAQFGIFSYLILFLIVFLETGVVVTPFLPGDSLLFVSGAFAAQGSLNLLAVFLIFLVAAILGDSLNYSIGKYLGPKIFHKEKSFFFNRDHLIKASSFYEKHGSKTIILARFIPIIRTFAPFVAGIGKMNYSKFILYNITGAIAWVSLFVFGGYFFSSLPFVEENLSLLIIAIIIVSFIPVILEFIKSRRKKQLKLDSFRK